MAALQRCDGLYEQCLRDLAEGQVDAAEQAALQRWELSPDEDAARLLAVTYLLQGRYQAALDIAKLPMAS
ncbi:MAG TPA: hypothetical protein VMM76_28455 [Pirellulaceae bacterium]|nr:hypothetical protein [Pirellulaceae bacterium]